MSDATRLEREQSVKKYLAAVRKVENAVAKFGRGEFEGTPREAEKQLQNALNRLSNMYSNPVIRGNDDFQKEAMSLLDRAYASYHAAQEPAEAAWQSRRAAEDVRLRQAKQRAWNDLSEHERELRLLYSGLPYKPR